MKVAILDAVASYRKWIAKVFQTVGAMKLKVRREMLVGANCCQKYIVSLFLNDLRLRERTKG